MKIADLPLHNGKAPRWLFWRMVKLAKAISEIIIYEYGTKEFLSRLSHPYWFQAFSCVLGFDWHSSGTTTTTTGALRIALEELGEGIALAGGKGKRGLKTPEEIEKKGLALSLSSSKISFLQKASRLSAKIDSSCIQDGYELYHHAIIFDEKGNYAIIQQGMKEDWARRYHWFNETSFLAGQQKIAGFLEKNVLNMTGKKAEEARKASLDVIKERDYLRMPARHYIASVDLSKRDLEFFEKIREFNPSSYEELLLFKGMGKKKIRALALISNLLYGTELDWKDPVKYAFAHGGKDGIPFPVDKPSYDESISFLREALEKAKLNEKTKLLALKRLNAFFFSQ